LKLHGGGSGPSALLAELVVNRLCQAWSLPVPAAHAIHLPAKFPWLVGTDEFNQLPSVFASQVGSIDRLFANMDRSRRNPNIRLDSRGKHWAIDHGSCLYLARLNREDGFPQAGEHFPRDLDWAPAELPALATEAAINQPA